MKTIQPSQLLLCTLALMMLASTQSLAADAKSAKKNANQVVEKDIEYATAGDVSLLLDLYKPKQSQGKLPVVVWVHGGGWKAGSKKNCKAAYLTQHGFAVASINYRLIPVQWPAQMNDCRAAVRWLRKNADQHGLDGAHIGVWGSSAGGHLVALMGTLDAAEDEAVSSQVQAVCDWFGPSDLLTMPPNNVGNGRTKEDVATSNGARLLGATVREVPELAKKVSALYQVTKDDAPFLIMHGEIDPNVPLSQSERLHAKLIATGVDSTFHIVKGAKHGGKEFNTPEVQQMVVDFFNKQLKPSR
ncbi:MAG: lipase [Blastopirellula sp.]|nr:MAG: lipase [Blastopirellula sp.]